MRNIATKLTNTYKAFRLLTDPTTVETLYGQLEEKREMTGGQGIKYDKANIFFHRHYLVQVVN